MKNVTMLRASRWPTVLVLALVVPVAMSGCGDSGPRSLPTADVRWAPSAPSGSIEEDPWVRAVRAGSVAFATAVNGSNFTDPSMMGTWQEDFVQDFADKAARRLDEGRAFVVLGPRPFTPLAVDVDESGTEALVVGCADDLAISPVPDDLYPEPWPQAFQFRLRLGPDGQRRITSVADLQDSYTLASGEQLTNEYCADVEIPHGLFEPVPDPRDLAELRGSDLLAPPAPSPSFAVELPE